MESVDEIVKSVDYNVRQWPCCMCPALSKDFKKDVCIPCNFVVHFKDTRGWEYFVRKGIGESFKTFYVKAGTKKEKASSIFEWRDAFSTAQEDLNKEAETRGWVPVTR